MLSRSPTAYDDKIYSADWRAWMDPGLPDAIAPTAILLDRHLGTPVEHKVAVIVDDVPVSYGALARRVAAVSAGLCGIGVVPENRILLFGTDSLDYITLWLGAVRIGAVPAVVSDLHKAPDLLYFIRNTAARLLFIDAEQLPKLAEIAAVLPASLETIIVRGEAGHVPELAGRRVITFAAIADSGAPAVAACPRHPDDVAYMFFSGGTTGTAKGITHLALDFVLIPQRQGRFWEYRESDVVFATSKKYLTHGLWPGLLIPLYWGATAVLIRRPPSPELVLETMAKAEVTKLVSVPTVLKNMIEHVRQSGQKPHCPALEFVASASEKIPPEIFSRFHLQFGVELFDSIGSSEITYEWIANRHKEFKRGSLGKPVFGYEVRLVSRGGGDVTEPGVPGRAPDRTSGMTTFGAKNTLFSLLAFNAASSSTVAGWLMGALPSGRPFAENTAKIQRGRPSELRFALSKGEEDTDRRHPSASCPTGDRP
jgi:benzoate-CoA ligase